MSLRIEDTNPESRDQNGGFWIPTTPAKPNSPKQQPICSNLANLEEPESTQGKLSGSVRLPWDFLEEASSYHNVPAYSSANLIGVTQGLDTWQAGFAANSDVYIDALCNFETWQTSKASSSGLYGGSVQMNNFSMNDADKWTDMSFGALLALANNSAPISMPHIFEGENSATPVPCFDLNFAPKETKGAAFSKSASLHFQPITPEKHRPDSEANQLCETTTAGQLQETHKPDKGGVNEAADLSKTPEQKKPRRRKHRPKVVKEGKTKRSPKTCPEKKPSPPDETPRVKRKYVRRKNVNNPASSSLEGETNKIDSNEQSSTTNGTPVGRTEFMRSKGIEKPESAMNKGTETDNINTVKYTRNSCRRSLNFDTDAHVRDEASSDCPSLNNEMEEQIVNLSATDQSRTNVQSHGVEEIMEKRNTSLTFQEWEVHMSRTARFRPRPVPSTMADHQSEFSRGKCQIVFSDVTHDKVENNVHVMVYKEGKWVPKSIDESMSRSSCLISEKETIGMKRPHMGTIAEAETCIANATATFYNSVPTGHSEISQNANKNDCSPEMYFYKKTRTALGFDTESSSLQYTTIASGSRLKPEIHIPVQHATSATNQATDLLTINPTVDGTQCGRQTFENLLALGPTVKNKKKRGKAREDVTMSPNPNPNPKKKGSKKSSFKNSTTQNIYMGSQSAINWKSMSPVDSLIEQLNELDLNANWSQVSVQNQNAYMTYHYQQQNAYMAYHYQQQNAIVPYQRGGAVVPFDGQVKRKRARPKVDLDDETTRVWRLLLENINSEGVDGTDEEKMRWWDEERRVFTGRADSFIARMHLVQGDRRFSPWKGSVVDSVVGVFLTQNVSDHLSSSAFMSLAARFPLEPKTSPVELHDAGPSHNSQEREICLLDPELNENLLLEPEKFPEKCVPIISLESDSNKSINLTGDGRDMDEVVSSQNSVVTSVDSPVAQTTKRTESCSLSNSDEEPAAKPDRFASSTSFVKLLQMADTILHGSTEISGLSIESASKTVFQKYTSVSSTEGPFSQLNDCSSDNIKIGMNTKIVDKQKGKVLAQGQFQENICNMQNRPSMDFTGGSSNNVDDSRKFENSEVNSSKNEPKANGGKVGKEQQNQVDWDSLRKQAQEGGKKERTVNTMDTVDWEAVRCADVNDIAQAVKERGMNNVLAERIKDFLNRIVRDHGSIDLEWLRDVPPDKANEYLLSVRGLGLKSVECVRLLTLHHLAFPVDTNVGRIAVRLGWVPLQPLPESLQLHLLELYPIMESIQKYLWPRLCKLDQRTLYELHYQLITFGKVFCTKSKPNCNACPMRGECRHFASAFASARLALPAPEDKRMVSASENKVTGQNPTGTSVNNMLQLPSSANPSQLISGVSKSLPIIEEPNSPEPIIEVPATPEYEQDLQRDIEDAFYEDPDEIPTIQLNMEQFTQNLQKVMQHSTELQEGDFSKALVALTPEAASIPVPKLKNISRLRTEHQVYELPDSHPLLEGLQVDKREPDDPSPYLLAIWTPGETEDSIEPPERRCSSTGSGTLCTDEACLSCNSIRELNSQTVRGTLLIPCRTAMRGSFPLNGTYFQVNEVFSDHESSKTPMDVPREWLWNLPRRTVYFGTSVPTIFKGLTTEQIQYCFWRGFVCVRGFDRVLRAPRPLIARLHFPASKLAKGKEKTSDD